MSRLPRILYIDSEPLMLRAVERFLKDEPFEARFVRTAEEALALAALLPFDLILVDHRFQDVEVIDLVRRLALVQSKARIILVGGYLNPVKHAEIGAPIAACIPKPWDPRRFVALLGELLRAPPANRPRAMFIQN